MIKAALVGCGLVADQHVSQIKRLPNAEIVAVCDTEPLMAGQMADRFHVPRYFSDLREMLAVAKPEVVHITTPAQTHFPLGKICLEAGCNIYVEKPFTVNAPQAEQLVALAESKGLRLTVGHNLQFNPEAIRMRELVRNGFLGGPPIYIECIQSFGHDDPTYGKALLGDRTHWVRSLPGSLLQNLISHGLAKVAEFFPGDHPTVSAHTFSSPYLKKIGQTDLVDELRAIIHDGDNTTAHFTFTTQLGAAGNVIALHGKKASITADSNSRMVVPRKAISLKSYLRFFLTPLLYAREDQRNTWRSINQFLKKDFHMDYGMKMLMQAFYQSIEKKTPPPIPYREILLVARLMDDIFAQIPKAPEPALAV